MANLPHVDPNILFRKIRNQFLAAITGIVVFVIFGIAYVVSLGVSESSKFIAVAAFVFISILTGYMVIKLQQGTQQITKIDEQNRENMLNASRQLWSLIVGFGEGCLENEVPDNRRTFVTNALSQVIESEMEGLAEDDALLRSILFEIKQASDSEVKQKRAFSEVLKEHGNI